MQNFRVRYKIIPPITFSFQTSTQIGWISIWLFFCSKHSWCLFLSFPACNLQPSLFSLFCFLFPPPKTSFHHPRHFLSLSDEQTRLRVRFTYRLISSIVCPPIIVSTTAPPFNILWPALLATMKKTLFCSRELFFLKQIYTVDHFNFL